MFVVSRGAVLVPVFVCAAAEVLDGVTCAAVVAPAAAPAESIGFTVSTVARDIVSAASFDGAQASSPAEQTAIHARFIVASTV